MCQPQCWWENTISSMLRESTSGRACQECHQRVIPNDRQKIWDEVDQFVHVSFPMAVLLKMK